jgi:preprotein translocase subunit Sec61beta
MASEAGMQMPGVFGGLMRYDEEVGSKLQLSPVHVIAFCVATLLFVFVLKLVFPITA